MDKVYIVTCDSVTEHVHHLGGNPPFLKSCPVHLTAESPWPSCLWLPCTFCTLCRGRGCMRSFCTSSPPSAGILRMVVTVVTEEGAIDHPTTHTTTHDGIGERREDFHSLLLLPGLPIVPLHSRRGSSIAFHTLILRCSKCHISALSARGTISFPWIPTAQLQSRGAVDLRSQNWCTLNVMAHGYTHGMQSLPLEIHPALTLFSCEAAENFTARGCRQAIAWIALGTLALSAMLDA